MNFKSLILAALLFFAGYTWHGIQNKTPKPNDLDKAAISPAPVDLSTTSAKEQSLKKNMNLATDLYNIGNRVVSGETTPMNGLKESLDQLSTNDVDALSPDLLETGSTEEALALSSSATQLPADGFSAKLVTSFSEDTVKNLYTSCREKYALYAPNDNDTYANWVTQHFCGCYVVGLQKELTFDKYQNLTGSNLSKDNQQTLASIGNKVLGSHCRNQAVAYASYKKHLAS